MAFDRAFNIKHELFIEIETFQLKLFRGTVIIIIC